MSTAMAAEFETFWKGCPAKVGKLAAQKEYVKARKTATAQELIDGMNRYRQNKPAWQTWVHPRTFLSQGRWMDDYDAPAVPIARELPDWYAEQYAAAVAREKARA